MLIKRSLEADITEKLEGSNKIVLLYGARQVGKTTLIKTVLSKQGKRVLEVNADERRYIDILASRNSDEMQSLTAGYEVIFIDEAQRIPDIGINLKILHDSQPNLHIIATGSSSFELANKVQEPLTGRTWTYTLYPIAFTELKDMYNSFELDQQKEDRMLYGSYPELLTLENREEKKQYLEEVSRAYLYKDILEVSTIKSSHKIDDLLRLLAYQVGNEVSLTELGTQLEMSKNTVEHYIDLLEKAFVLTRLSGFSRNLRKEVTKKDKFFFNDLGIRNIVIDNLKPLSQRNDVGQLWENFIIIERKKKIAYERTLASTYFWRTYTGAEIDYVEEREGKLYGYECKYRKKNVATPMSWKSEYEGSFEIIHPENYQPFIV